MKALRVLLVVAVGMALVFSMGCAARQTVKQDTEQPVVDSKGVVDDTPEPATKASKKYVVKKGDTLWEISGMGKIYKDTFQWPLLYKANRDQIQDPDIIEVDQELSVKEDFSQSEVSDAIQKAKDTPPYKPHTAARKTLPLRY